MSFKDIIGQDKAINIIGRTLARERMPSAYLFAGEYGVGKKLAAVNLAKAINCQESINPPSPLPTGRAGPFNKGGMGGFDDFDCCDECASCAKIDAGTHPDFAVIAPEKGEIRVSEIRSVSDALSFRPYEGKTKVVIIDDADAMNQSAANAFLKTLEEPPDDSLLILISAHPDRLPETIRSRCSRINFLPLSADSCKKVIGEVLARAGKDREVSGDMLSAVAGLSMGRPGLALGSDMLKERERFISLLRSMLGGGAEIWTDREEMGQWLDMLFIFLRDMILAKMVGYPAKNSPSFEGKSPGEEILLNADIGNLISGMDKTKDIMSVIRIYDKLTALKRAVDFNLNKSITWNYTSSVLKTIMCNAPCLPAGR